jgi:hypothetical protein
MSVFTASGLRIAKAPPVRKPLEVNYAIFIVTDTTGTAKVDFKVMSTMTANGPIPGISYTKILHPEIHAQQIAPSGYCQLSKSRSVID